jgi:hypothetical protein
MKKGAENPFAGDELWTLSTTFPKNGAVQNLVVNEKCERK